MCRLGGGCSVVIVFRCRASQELLEGIGALRPGCETRCFDNVPVCLDSREAVLVAFICYGQVLLDFRVFGGLVPSCDGGMLYV